MIRHRNKLIGIASAVALFSGTAYAGTVTNPLLSGTATISGAPTPTTWNLSNTAPYTNNGDGTFTYSGTTNSSSTVWSLNWGIIVNPDPFINATLAITNSSSITQHFDILFTLPVGSPLASPTQMNGSMSTSFQDLNNSGLVTLSNVNWSGKIDGVDVMTLTTFDGTCGPGSPGCVGSLGTVSGGPLPSGAVNTNIGNHLSFDLTAGDKATFTSFFQVVPVPLPAAVWLFGSGLLGLGAIARRRKK